MASISNLWGNFNNPSREARPRVWWHWMNGNINQSGIEKDLDWLDSIGIGGVQVFEGGMGSPLVTTERLIYKSERWQAAIAFAAEQAAKRSMELTIATSPGWSALGGPQVKPVDAMKKIVWSKTTLGTGFSHQLKALPEVSGPFQDCPNWADGSPIFFARDTVCLAIPISEKTGPRKPNRVTVSKNFEGDVVCLSDESFNEFISIRKDPDSRETVYIDYEFSQATEITSASVGISGPKGFGAPLLPDAKLHFSIDGIEYEFLADFPIEKNRGQNGEIPARSITFRNVEAKYFRLELIGNPISEALPAVDPGVAPIPFRPSGIDRFLVSEFALFSQARVNAFEYKAGFGVPLDYYKHDTQGDHRGLAINDVIDVTDFMSSDGTLNWQHPEGEWMAVRFGYSLTGHQNGPAPVEATGLEIDKLDKNIVENYLADYFETYRSLEIHSLLSDSIESGPQNWTDNLLEEFQIRRGYDFKSWLPSVAGFIVVDSKQTDQALWDFRQTIAELISENMYGAIGKYAEHNGLKYYAEALEDHRPQLGDDLAMRARADVPMGAMWAFDPLSGPANTYIADLKGASSVAHVYGKSSTGAESFSAFGAPFTFAPKHLKHIADLELALGVTRFCIHTSPHQPEGVAAPGVTLSPLLGQTFTRHETWANQAKPWIDYLSRGSEILNSGMPVADILYFVGEEAPVTAIWGDSDFDIPSGFDFDLISREGLLTQITTEKGQLKSAQGTYKLLFLGGTSQKMSVTVLRKLVELQSLGAQIVGDMPTSSPGLDDQIEFKNLSAQLGQAIVHKSLADALEKTLPDWSFSSSEVILDASLRANAPIRCIHRKNENFDIYFVANTQDATLNLDAKFSATRNYRYLLNAVSPEYSRVWSDSSLHLEPYGSTFVVYSDIELEDIRPQENILETLTLGIPPLADKSEVDKYFSGTKVIEFDFELENTDDLHLDIGKFESIAQIRVNGFDVGVIWATGQTIPVHKYLKVGSNRLVIAVTNTWWNRVLGDALNKASEQSDTYVAYPVHLDDAKPIPFGVFGPTRLIRLGVNA